MLKAEAEGITPRGADRADRRGTAAIPRRASTSASTTGIRRIRRRTPSCPQEIYRRLKAKGLIATRTDRAVLRPGQGDVPAGPLHQGRMPDCHAKDQYGDACEVCSSVYSPTDLIKPYSTITGAAPVLRSLRALLLQALGPALPAVPRRMDRRRQPAARSGEQGAGMAGRQRRTPGSAAAAQVRRTGARQSKRPAGRLGHLPRRALLRHPDPGRAGQVLLRLAGCAGRLPRLRSRPIAHGAGSISNPSSRPATARPPTDWCASRCTSSARTSSTSTRCSGRRCCEFADFKVPDHIFVHGFLTVSGEKMSKSRGTGLSPLKYLELGMNPEWLRYYLAAKLNNRVEDVDFNADDFVARVNSDLIGKFVNIASRCAGFLTKRFDGVLAAADPATGAGLRRRLGRRRRGREPLPATRIRQGDARDHGARRPGQPVHRQREAVGPGQAARTSRSGCTGSARTPCARFAT